MESITLAVACLSSGSAAPLPDVPASMAGPSPASHGCSCAFICACPRQYIDPAASIQWESFTSPDLSTRQAAQILAASIFYEQGFPGSPKNRFWPQQLWGAVADLAKKEPFSPNPRNPYSLWIHGKRRHGFPARPVPRAITTRDLPEFVSRFCCPHAVVGLPDTPSPLL